MPNQKPKRLTVNAAFFQEIKEDHKHLRDLIEKLCGLTSNRPALGNHKREFVTLLAELRDQLALHFALEEAYGYFEDALEETPRFHEQADRLRGQHCELYLLIQQISESAVEVCDLEEPDLLGIADQFEAFNMAFRAHESAELNLILEALNLDMGVGD
ncbi:MAG: hemerythrin domain-containing protein [Bdellovibrionales bacterium]|nr:hemerythrin domain-containing protein [Bdellovibrionales bacterium]